MLCGRRSVDRFWLLDEIAESLGEPSDARTWFTRSRDAWIKYAQIPAMRPVDGNVARISAKLDQLK